MSKDCKKICPKYRKTIKTVVNSSKNGPKLLKTINKSLKSKKVVKNVEKLRYNRKNVKQL